MDLKHILNQPAYVENADEETGEAIHGAPTYARISSPITSNRWAMDPELSAYIENDLKLRVMPTIGGLEQDRLRNERNQGIANWRGVVNTDENIFPGITLENPGKDSTRRSHTFFNRDDNGKMPTTSPNFLNWGSQFLSEGTEEPRMEDNHANFHQPTQKDSSNAAMARFERRVRDLETASYAATYGSKTPPSVMSSEESGFPGDSRKRDDSPGKDEEHHTMKCICSSKHEYDMIMCGRCDTWQHLECYYLEKDIPTVHFCKDCMSVYPELSKYAPAIRESERHSKWPTRVLPMPFSFSVNHTLPNWDSTALVRDEPLVPVQSPSNTSLDQLTYFKEPVPIRDESTQAQIMQPQSVKSKGSIEYEYGSDSNFDGPYFRGPSNHGLSENQIEKILQSKSTAEETTQTDSLPTQPTAEAYTNSGNGKFPNADVPNSEKLNNHGFSNIVIEQQIEKFPRPTSTAEKITEGDDIPPQPTAETYTDSGYASNTARPPKLMQIHTSAEESDIQECTENDDDVKSIYSDASSLPILRKTGYINELANEFAQVIQPYQVSDDILDRIFEVLPDLLKTFALSFGHPLSNGMQRDVMVFIHRYRRDIVTTFKDHLLTEDTETQNSLSKDKMLLDDIMNLWDRSGDPPADEDPINPGNDETEDLNVMEIDDEVDEIDENELPGIEAYRSLIRDAPGYNWLLENLRRECVLAPAEPNVIGEIRNTILKALPSSSRISRRKPTEMFDMSFMVDWDPNSFLQNEEYTEEPEYAIERAITLTCSTSNAQALTCGEYLRQTWPSTGEQTLKLLKSLVSGENKASVVCSDGTTLTASSQQPHSQGSPSICIDTRGTAACIAEIGERLAWLISAVRSSPYAREVAYSRPYIDGIQIGHVTYEETPKVMYMCTIGVNIRRGDRVTETTNGQCWHNLFGSPVVVEGFPIPRRPEEHSAGIEIPLNIMAALTQTRKVHNFAGKTLLKGFSDMLIPMKYSQGMVTWHLVHSKNGERVSYLESDNFETVDIQTAELEKSRHILGWCPEMKTYAGAVDACYSVKNSRLPRPSDRGALVDALLSSGHFVMGGTPFSIGRKDIRLRRNSYIMKIKWVSQKFVVLWDVGEERGWLVNGASALLHLVRGSLAQDQFYSRFSSLCSFSNADLQEALKRHQTDAALGVLLNQRNLQVEIYSEDEGHVRFKDYVEDFYDLLEKMIDYQFKAVGTGSAASNIPRSLLEGWDFNDLTTGRDPVYPRQALLHQDGLSWVDFTRSVHAITLFGRGFGEIIQPAGVSCSAWRKLPQGRSYLAAGVTDLHNIMESDGDPYSTPVKLTHDILWYTTDEKFAQCRCKTEDTRCDLTQILLPFRLHREMTAIRSQLPEKGGAVIFGSSSVHKWFWGDIGDPSKTPSEYNCLSSSLISSGDEKRGPQSDSGIGRSLGSSTSRWSENLGRSTSHQYDEEYSENTHAGISESEYYAPSNPTKSHLSRYSSPVAKRYQVGIVCALHLELMAVRMLFDETHEKVAISDEDPNYYALGSIAGHNVVAVCLPHGLYGTNVAADVTSNMKRSFPTLKFCLLVGIGAGVPSPKNDVRLGDVVISTPKGGYSGVLPYDMIKSSDSGVSELNGYLCPPPSHLMCAISELESDPTLSSTPLQKFLEQIQECKEQYKNPGPIHDQLFESLYVHRDGHDTCDHCDPHHEIRRPPRLSTHPKLHYGLIASGNQVMKSAQIRDRLSREHNVLCFEMEGAGIMNSFPCLIIRGICDYADSHKNKRWQNYAAAVAAAYAKLLLSRLRDYNNGFDGGLAESMSDYRQRSRKRPPSVESIEESLAKRGKGENG